MSCTAACVRLDRRVRGNRGVGGALAARRYRRGRAPGAGLAGLVPQAAVASRAPQTGVAVEVASMQLDRPFVAVFSAHYVAGMGTREGTLLGEVGPAMRARGHATLEDLLEIGRWKSSRATGRMRRNDPADVIDVSAMAFKSQTPSRLRHRILTLLSGVGVPVASAVLTVWDPTAHTVTDWRARGSLARLEGVPDDVPDLPYVAYNEWSVETAAQLGVTLRDLDRALWSWSKLGHRDAPPDRG